MRKRKENKLRQVLNKFKIYMYFIISVFLIVSLIRNISRIRSAEKRIDKARVRVENLEDRKNELEAKLESAQSELHIERQLRDGLGLAKEEEIVIVLPDEEILRRVAPEIEDEQEEYVSVPNWKKWWNLFVMVEN